MSIPPLFTKQEYKIVIESNGHTSITDMNGVTVELDTATWIMRKLNASITVNKYLYVIMGGENHTNEWKIGISSNPHRRAKEVKGWVWNRIPLESTVCWELEKDVHDILARYRRIGEWFCFDDEPGRKLLNKLAIRKNRLISLIDTRVHSVVKSEYQVDIQ